MAFVERGQRRLADWLNARTAGHSTRSMAVCMTLIGVAFGGYCLYLIFSSIFNL
jgi:hypothetical protein